jgi:hypothetical protein
MKRAVAYWRTEIVMCALAAPPFRIPRQGCATGGSIHRPTPSTTLAGPGSISTAQGPERQTRFPRPVPAMTAFSGGRSSRLYLDSA